MRDGSFFTESKITLQKWLILLYWWVREYPVSDAAEEAEVTRATGIQAYLYFTDVCTAKLLQAPILLGGPGIILQVDDSLYRHKPKVSLMRLYISILTLSHILWPSHHRTTVAELQQMKCGCLASWTPPNHQLWDSWR